MKRIIILLCFLGVYNLKAQKIVSAEIFYNQIDTFKYVLKANVYRQCNGSPLTNLNGYIYTDSLIKFQLNFKRISITNISDSCGNPCHSQNQNSNLGFEKHTFIDTVNLKDTFYYEILTRNICVLYFAIHQDFRLKNLTTLEDSTLYIDAMVNRCLSNEFVHSPEFNFKPKFQNLLNFPLVYNPGILNNNIEDSLGFELVNIEYDKDKNINYKNNFSVQYPVTPFCPPVLGTINCKPLSNAKPPRGFYFDNQTANTIYTPTDSNEKAIIKYKMTQYRFNFLTLKYEKIGYVQREMIMQIVKTALNNPPYIKGSNLYSICNNNKICFKINATDDPFNNSNMLDTVYISWNNGIKNGNFKIIDSTLREKEIEFCYTPKLNSLKSRTEYFSVMADDKKCYSYTSTGFLIKVQPKTILGNYSYEDIKGCQKFVMKSEPNLDSNLRIYNPKTYFSIKNLNSNKLVFSSSKTNDTFKYEESGFYQVYAFQNNIFNCPTKTKFDTFYFEAISPLLNLKKDSFLCSGDTIVLGNENYLQNYSKVSWEYPIGNIAKDSSNTFQYIHNGNRNIVRMRFQNQFCNEFKDVEFYTFENFNILKSDTIACENDLITLKIDKSDIKKPFNFIWIVNGNDSFFNKDSIKLKIDANKFVQLLVYKKPNCHSEKTIQLYSTKYPEFYFKDSIICLTPEFTINPIYLTSNSEINSYSWKVNNVLQYSDSSSLVLNPSEGVYFINLKVVNKYNCSVDKKMKFKVLKLPEFAIIDSSSCSFKNQLIKINNPSNFVKYNWFLDSQFISNSITKFSYPFNKKHLINIKSEDTFGCVFEQNLVVNTYTKPIFKIIKPSPFCSNQIISIKPNILIPNSIKSFVWFENGINTNIQNDFISNIYSQKTLIKCIIKDSNNCISEDTLTIIPQILNFNILGDLNYYMNDSVKLKVNNEFSLYKWSTGSLEKENVFLAKNKFSNYGNHNISVEVKDSIGCKNTKSVIINIQKNTSTKSIESISFKLYPNPNNGEFIIESEAGNLIQIYSIDGKLIFETIILNDKNQIDLSSYDDGVYLLKIKNIAIKLYLIK